MIDLALAWFKSKLKEKIGEDKSAQVFTIPLGFSRTVLWLIFSHDHIIDSDHWSLKYLTLAPCLLSQI